MGCVEEALAAVFAPAAQPLGGGTTTIHVVAGEYAPGPVWIGGDGNCAGCDPYVWLRLVRRARTTAFPAETETSACDTRQMLVIEVGIARCVDDPTPRDAYVQWDDAWRIDRALCAGLSRAVDAGAAIQSALGAGEPYGPEGMIAAWLQTGYAQI